MSKDSMINEEVRTKERSLIFTYNQSEALVTELKGRSKTRNFHKRDKSESHDKSRSKSKTRKEIICYNCGKLGHVKMNRRFHKREYSMGKYKCNENKNDKDTTTIAHNSDVYIV